MVMKSLKSYFTEASKRIYLSLIHNPKGFLPEESQGMNGACIYEMGKKSCVHVIPKVCLVSGYFACGRKIFFVSRLPVK